MAALRQQYQHWRAFRDLMLHDLALVLKCEPDELPRVFCTNIPKPLKIGIFDDMMAKYAPDEARLSQWLKFWTNRREYLHRVAYGKHRHDLDGDDVEEIADRDRTFSKMRLYEAFWAADQQRRLRCWNFKRRDDDDEGEE